MNLRFLAVELLFTVCIPFCLFAGGATPVYKTYDVNNGLPSNEVHAVVQDHDGYLWIATDRGVSRFDGHTFRTFTQADGLADNSVLQLSLDLKGRVWMIGAGRNLSYCQGGQAYSYRGNKDLHSWLEQDRLLSVATDANDSIWVGTTRGLLKGHLQDSTLFFQRFPPGPPSVLYLKQIESQIVHYCKSLFSVGNQIGLNNRKIKANRDVHWQNRERPIFFEDGGLWVNHGNQLLHIPFLSDTAQVIPLDHFALALNEGVDGYLWICTRSNGAFRVDPSTSPFKTDLHMFPGEGITSAFRDGTGGYWFGTLGKGLHYVPNPGYLTFHAGKELSGKMPVVFEGNPDGSLWVGHREGKIDRVTRDTVEPIQLGPDISDCGEIIHMEHLGTLGMAVTFSSFPNFFSAAAGGPSVEFFPSKGKFYAGIGSHLWVQNNGEIMEVDPSNFYPRSCLLAPNNLVKDMLEYEPGQLLLGTVLGLDRLDAETGLSQPFLPDAPLLRQRVQSIAQVGNTILLATRGSGLVILRLTSDGTAQDSVWRIGFEEGLSSDQSNHVFPEGDSVVWVSTHRGLNKLAFAPGWKLKHIDWFNHEDGLASNQVLQTWVNNGVVWICTPDGVSFMSRNPEQATGEIPLYLTQMRINGQDTLPRNGYVFHHSQNNVRFVFRAISFRRKPDFGYEYRLRDVQDEWTYTQDTAVTFPQLAPGSFVFELRAVERPGFPVTATKELAFKISIPWWDQFHVRLGGTLLLILGLGAVIRAISLRKTRRMEMERTIVALQSQALRAQMNPHFAFNALNTVQGHIAQGDEMLALQQLGRFSELLRLVLRHSDADWIPMADELRMLNLYLELETERFEDQIEKEIRVSPEFDLHFDRLPPMILQPFVENAIWHGLLPKKGNRCLSIQIDKVGGFAVCTIEDNGVGRQFHKGSTNSDHFSIGTGVTVRRLALIETHNHQAGGVTIEDLFTEDGEAAGTRIHLKVPLN